MIRIYLESGRSSKPVFSDTDRFLETHSFLIRNLTLNLGLMKKVKVLVKVIYFTEENDLVVHCPQLALYGVCEGILKENLLNEKLVLECFEGKLKKQIQRFSEKAEFLEDLLIHGHWSINHEDFGPRPLNYYVENQLVLKRIEEEPRTKTIDYIFEYGILIAKRFKNISKIITITLNQK